MIFKNCNYDEGKVEVWLNNIPIEAIARPDQGHVWYDDYNGDFYHMGSLGNNKMEAEFAVKPGDVLTLKEEDGGIIKVISLTVKRGKNFLKSIGNNQYVKRYNWF